MVNTDCYMISPFAGSKDVQAGPCEVKKLCVVLTAN